MADLKAHRERRARAQAQDASYKRLPKENVPLSQPARTLPAHKTLIDIAAERELLSPKPANGSVASSSIIPATINPDGSLSGIALSPKVDDHPDFPYLDIAIYTSTLTFLHFTLTLLVHNQYATEPPSLIPLFLSTTVFSLTPALLFLLVFMLHPRTSHPATQGLFAALSVIAGIWLVRATNDEPYLAVMKKAPVLGTLWVWAIVEMKWEWAVGCLSIVGCWGWWKNYSIL